MYEYATLKLLLLHGIDKELRRINAENFIYLILIA